MSYKKNASSNRDALFGPSSSSTSSSRGKSSGGGSSTNTSRPAAPPPPPPQPTITNRSSNNNAGYTSTKTSSSSSARNRSNLLSGDARAAKLKEAEDYKAKAKAAMSVGFLKRPDPLMASTYYKRAADCYKAVGDKDTERYYRASSGQCHALVGAFATAADEYTAAADLVMDKFNRNQDSSDDDDHSSLTEQDCVEASNYHKLAMEAWKNQGDNARAAQSALRAALCLNASSKGTLLNRASLTQMEEAVEMHVPDVLNPFARYRQTGHSSFVDPDSEHETVEKPSPQTLAMAKEHLVSRSYSHEPLQHLVSVLSKYGEYASALYATGAISKLLESEGISTLSLGRSYVVETILQLAMGDSVAAEQTFLSRHCNSRPYLSSREAQLAEELTQAIKRRDSDALDEVRSPQGKNRSALANLDPNVRDVVFQLRISGVARRAVVDNTSAPSGGGGSSKEAPTSSLQEVLNMKTGYEAEAEEGANLNGDDLAAELDGLDFGGLGDDSDNHGGIGGDDDGSLEDDDDIDLR